MANLDLHYRKTAAGAEELVAKRIGLSREQRNLLIVADGRHALSIYCKAVGCDPAKLSALADDLLGMQLIEAQVAAQPTHAAAVRPPTVIDAAPGAAHAGPEAIRQQLCELASQVFGAQLAKPVIARLEKAPVSPGELVAAAEGAAKLAKLTIDEDKAQAFLLDARRLLGV
jgi:hypothetical protein